MQPDPPSHSGPDCWVNEAHVAAAAVMLIGPAETASWACSPSQPWFVCVYFLCILDLTSVVIVTHRKEEIYVSQECLGNCA